MPDWRRLVRHRLELPELKNRRDQAIVEELAGQLEDLYETARSWGHSEVEAERYALEEFPDWGELRESLSAAEHHNRLPALGRMLARVEEFLRQEGGFQAWFADLIQDMRYSARQVIKSPGLAVAVVLSLGVGIAANVAVLNLAFSVLRPNIPVENPEGLVQLYMRWDQGEEYSSFSIPNFEDVRDGVKGFADAATWAPQPFHVGIDEEIDRTWGAMVSGSYFRTLGIRMEIGRDFAPEESSGPGAHPVLLLSHVMWQRRFDGDPEILGKTLHLNGTPFTIIGVVDRRFRGGMAGISSDLFVPLAARNLAMPGWTDFTRGNHWLMSVVARLGPGVAIDEAQAQVDAVMADLRARYPESNRHGYATVLSFRESELHPFVKSRVQTLLALLEVVVGLLLLLTCANVAGLFLARASARVPEFGIRLTLGANRVRLIRQMLAESSLYALGAGIVGYWLFAGVTFFLISAVPEIDLPVAVDPGSFPVALGLTLPVVLVAVLLFGLLPALEVSRKSVATGLLNRRNTPDSSSHRLRNGLITGQVAASLALLMGAGLVLQSLRNLKTVDLGFNPDDQVIAAFDLDVHGYDESRGRAFYASLRERLLGLPNSRYVGLSTILPLNFDRSIAWAWPEEWASPGGAPAFVSRTVVDGGFFDAMEIPLRQGRVFSASEMEDTGAVMVVNEEFVRRYWPGKDPVGRQVRLNKAEGGPLYEVVGVVADGKYLFVGEPQQPQLYLAYNGAYRGRIYVHVRSVGKPSALFGSIRRIVRDLDPTLPVHELTTMRDQVAFALLPSRVTAWSVGAFALVALLLTAVGLYGLVAYTVSLRTKEIGVRIALGARPRNVLLSIQRRSLGITAVGLTAGVVMGFLGSGLLSKALFQVGPLDPLVTGVSLGVTLVTVLLASYLPARRATRIHPISALNQD